MQWRLINSRFRGKCAVCSGEIEAGAQIYWKRRQAVHVACMTDDPSAAAGPQDQPPVQEARKSRKEERIRAFGNVRYVPPDQPDPDPAEWEYRKTSKKGNRVYVRRPVTPEMVRKLFSWDERGAKL